MWVRANSGSLWMREQAYPREGPALHGGDSAVTEHAESSALGPPARGAPPSLFVPDPGALKVVEEGRAEDPVGLRTNPHL